MFIYSFLNQPAAQDAAAVDFNLLHPAYGDGQVSHPNQLANQTIGPVFTQFIIGLLIVSLP